MHLQSISGSARTTCGVVVWRERGPSEQQPLNEGFGRSGAIERTQRAGRARPLHSIRSWLGNLEERSGIRGFAGICEAVGEGSRVAPGEGGSGPGVGSDGGGAASTGDDGSEGETGGDGAAV